MAADPTPRPWSVHEDGDSIWIEGPEGSAATEPYPFDRRVICESALFGEDELDEKTRSNMALIVELVNAGEPS